MTSALLSEALAPLRADASRAAVLLDVDGTLAPIVEHADQARVPEGTRKVLIRLANRYGVVACVSGRRASEARAMVSIGTISYLGSHGAELLRAGWTEPVIDPVLEEWVRRIRDFSREFDTAELRRQRVRIEDKGAIVAFHWRGARDEDAARASVEALAAAAEKAGLRPHWGRKVLEVRPPLEFDKGKGVTEFLKDTVVTAALYVGDDLTDVDAFRALRQLAREDRLQSVVCVAVGSEELPSAVAENADLMVQGTEGVLELLTALVAD